MRSTGLNVTIGHTTSAKGTGLGLMRKRPPPAGGPASSREGAGEGQGERGGPPATAEKEDKASGLAQAVDTSAPASERECEFYADEDADAD
eukprot:3399993-Pyramimonas_sp.AAC.1